MKPILLACLIPLGFIAQSATACPMSYDIPRLTWPEPQPDTPAETTRNATSH